MAISSLQLRKHIIRPALSRYGLWDVNSEELLMLTAAQESKLGYYLRQLDDGPGLGPWQMEEATFNWLRDGVSWSALADHTPLKGKLATDMVYDLRLAALAARLRYYVDPAPIPQWHDVEGLAKYWKRVYNTSAGAGRWDEAAQAYRYYVVEGKQ